MSNGGIMARAGKGSPPTFRVLAFVCSLALVLMAPTAGADELNQTVSTNDGTVTMRVRVVYSRSSCTGGTTTYKITGVYTKFTRQAGSGRRVPTSHTRAQQDGHTCKGVYLEQHKEGTWNPVFGCGSRCGANETAQGGVSTSFKYIRVESGCMICAAGGSGDGHAKTASGAALNPDPLCLVLDLTHTGQLFCPDSNP
jgi:hypothetical protein